MNVLLYRYSFRHFPNASAKDNNDINNKMYMIALNIFTAVFPDLLLAFPLIEPTHLKSIAAIDAAISDTEGYPSGYGSGT